MTANELLRLLALLTPQQRTLPVVDEDGFDIECIYVAAVERRSPPHEFPDEPAVYLGRTLKTHQ